MPLIIIILIITTDRDGGTCWKASHIKGKSLTKHCETFVVHPGLEPRLADPESDVLPLHQWTISLSYRINLLLFFLKSGCKSTTFFAIDKKIFKIYFQNNVYQWNIFVSHQLIRIQNRYIKPYKSQIQAVCHHLTRTVLSSNFVHAVSPILPIYNSSDCITYAK